MDMDHREIGSFERGEDTSSETADWWDCPKCGGNTRVCRGPNVPTERECVDCEWSFTFPEVSK